MADPIGVTTDPTALVMILVALIYGAGKGGVAAWNRWGNGNGTNGRNLNARMVTAIEELTKISTANRKDIVFIRKDTEERTLRREIEKEYRDRES